MREMTNLTVMIGAFSGASIPHLGHPTLENLLWLTSTSFASASIALYGRAMLDRKARRDSQDQEVRHTHRHRAGDAHTGP